MKIRTPFTVILTAALLMVGLAGTSAAWEEPEQPVTTLGRPDLAYEVVESGYAALERADIRAVVVNNGEAPDVLPEHRPGYSGLASLTHRRRPDNLFVPAYAGLNFEHIHDGTTQSRDVLFEPRRWPMELRRVGAHAVELYQAATPTWKLESCQRYELLPDGAVQLTVECIPREDVFRRGYIGLFWASYIHQPESKAIHFRGVVGSQTGTADSSADWIDATSPSHGTLATHVGVNDDRRLAHDDDFPLTLVFNRSRYRYVEPWYFGTSGDMSYVLIFRPRDQVRFAQSPSGGGSGNPAWDFQYFIPDYEVGRLYQFVVRALYLPTTDRDGIARRVEPHLAELSRE